MPIHTLIKADIKKQPRSIVIESLKKSSINYFYEMDIKVVSRLSNGKKMNVAFMAKVEKEILTSLRSVMDRVTSIWRELGVQEELQCIRSKTAQDLVIAFMEEIVEDEIRLYLEHVERIDKYKKELDELTEALNVEPVIIAHTMTLFEKESFLRSKLDVLVKEKHTRIKTLQDLKKAEEKLCTMLSLPAYKVCSEAGIPTRTSLNELEDHVRMLKEERERRHKKFRIAKQELTTIMETTELVPETNFEREVICYEDDQFLLSSENLKELEKFVAKVQGKRLELEKQKTALLEKLVKLWDRLNVSDSERKEFLSNHTGYRIKIMRGIQLEIERCEKIKKQNLKSYIKIVHEELQELWVKCHISDSEQKQFLGSIDKTSEEALTACETKVECLTKYYNDTKAIFDKIAMRQELWNRMIDFENKANDPNRYVNRGGTLLQEERERKKLQKDLPKLESDLFRAIEDYEECSETKFLYNGENFQEMVRNQWAQRLDEKESKKLQRQSRRTLVVQPEVDVRTPSKKRSSVAPNSAPSKMLRSNNGVAIFRTRGVSQQINTPDVKQKSRSKSCNNVKLTPKRASPRLTLMKKRQGFLVEHNKNKKSINSTDSTTYSEFAKELSKPSRINFHSSINSPKKVLGGKTCNRMRKSAGLPKKSIQKLTKIDLKLTPVRGKLGLPFLI